MSRETAIVRAWLFAICGMIAAMVVVGGATRLTHSGLSITEWKPIMGALPPLSEADWQDTFAKYQQIPEAKILNPTMTLPEFKAIFWWEWCHRLLGRLIGVVFLVPLGIFVLRGWIDRGQWLRLGGLFLLGGLQGAVGWYMVASGLAERVDVSQYRLAMHLGLAVLILALALWMALDLGARAAGRPRPAGALVLAAGLAGLIFVQILLGAFVAGLDAGLSHNTWPLMDGALVPDGLLVLSPWWINAFENVMTVQFNHRMVAYAVVLLAGINVAVLHRRKAPRRLTGSALAVLVAVLLQIALGIATLLSAVPISLGLAHQAGAVLVLALATWHLHRVVR